MSSRVVVCPSCQTKNRVPAVASGFPRCAHCKNALPWVADATDNDFDQAVTVSGLVLVDLWAEWCGPCRMVAPILDRLAREYAGRLKVVKVDVDANRALSSRYEAQSIPLLLVMRSGDVVERVVGAQPYPTLKQVVERHLPTR